MVFRSRSFSVLMAVVALVALAVPNVFATVRATSVSPQEVVVADAYESDDTSATAKVLPSVSWHSFHSDTDIDTFVISNEETGTPYCVELQMWSGHSDFDTELLVFGPDWDGVDFDAFIAECDDHDYFPTYASNLFFIAQEPGDYYVVAKPLSEGYWGNYKLTWEKGIGTRIAGASRTDTAVEVSRLMFSDAHFPGYEEGTNVVVLANSRSFPDALAGGVLASVLEGSLLLTPGDVLAPETAEEISRVLSYGYWADYEPTVYVLGGTGAISDAVVEEVGMIHEVEHVVRLAGANRYETAASIARAVYDEVGVVPVQAPVSTAYIVNGNAWADALAAGPVASWEGSPILMVGADSIPATTTAVIDDLGIENLVVVGGESVVASGTMADLAALVSGETTRIAGANRWETARLIAQYGVDTLGMSGDRMTLVSGENFPDGLSATPLSWWTSGPLLLTPKMTLASSVKTFMDDNGPMWSTSYLVGGSGAVSDEVFEEWRMYYGDLDYVK